MLETSSITLWLNRLKAGDRDEAVEQLWKHYFTALVGLARRHLGTRSRAVSDEEDVVLSAFQSFVDAAQGGRFPRLEDRDDLWQVLLVVTSRKAIDHLANAGRLKRGGGQTIQPLQEGIDIVQREPEPGEAIAVAEELELLLNKLGEPLLREISLLKLDGFTNEEIAQKISRSVPTVERKLALIRDRWLAE